MTIAASDIVLYKSERLTDTSDGGGYPTSRTVTDNLSNDVFPGISELDSLGTTKFRKLAMGVDTETVETYYGAGVYILNPPSNPAVDVLLIDSTDYADEASDIKNAIESYLIKSVLTPHVLYGPHPVGLTTLYVYARTSDPIPEPGEVYCIDDGTEAHDTYFRVIDVESQIREFEDDGGVFYKRVITITMNKPLEIPFTGQDIPVRRTISPAVKIRSTVSAGTVDFHSITPIDPVDSGELIIDAESVYSNVIPSSEQEIPIVDYLAGTENTVLIGTASTAFPIVIGANGSRIYLPCAVKPGSVFVTGTATYSDNGDGTLSSGGNTATINYDVADVTFPTTGTWTISAIPAATITSPAHTLSIPITIQNRGYTYIRTLSPIPSPGLTRVDYLVDGVWYSLTDDGSGILSGTGTGVLSFQTGSLRITTEAYPDIESSVLIRWATEVHLESRAGDINITLPAMQGYLDESGVDFSSVNANWLSEGVPKTASASQSGNFSGDGTGFIRKEYVASPAEGVKCFYSIIPNSNAVPDSDSLLEITYQKRSQFQESFFGINPVNNEYTFTINGNNLPLTPERTFIKIPIGTYTIGWPRYTYAITDIVTSDENGNLTSELDILDTGSTLNPTTGLVRMRIKTTAISNYFYGSWADYNVILTPQGSASFEVWGEKVATYSQTSDSAAISTLQIDLTPLDDKVIALDGIVIDIANQRLYTKRGVVYREFNPLTGGGIAIGGINYESGILTLSDWDDLTFVSPIIVRSLAVIRGDWGIDYVYGRTPISSLRLGSFEISATTLGGVTYTAIADMNGIVKDDNEDAIDGTIASTTGIFALRFGEFVEDSSLTPDEKAEPWYDPENIIGGLIWRPKLMLPNSLRINAVGLFHIPASEEDIGIDSTRLPQDGRVRSLKKGDKVIVHNTLTYTLPNPLSAGQQIQLPRGSLSMCRLFDTESDLVPTTKWSVNLSTGLITMANPLDLTGYPQPLSAKHTIRDSAKVIDSLISGQTTLSRALSHSYPSGSYVSSLLVAGNRFARVENLRTIETWIDFEHADGDPAIGQYNDVDFPPVVTNKGCEDDDWAIVFQSPSAFVAIGRRRGQLLSTGSTASDYSPINLLTGIPFFTLYSAAWSGGFFSGNALRFETRTPKFPFWTVQAIQPTTPPLTGDVFEWATFGNVE